MRKFVIIVVFGVCATVGTAIAQVIFPTSRKDSYGRRVAFTLVNVALITVLLFVAATALTLIVGN